MDNEHCNLEHIKKALENAEQMCSGIKDPGLKSVAFSKVLDCLQMKCCKGGKRQNICNQQRCGGAFIYIIFWGLSLAIFCIYNGPELLETFKNWFFLWCVAWGAFGIAAGLWNSREDHAPRKPFHYFTYYLFVWIFATILAIAISADKHGIQLYALSLVTALATGFAGDRLAGNIMDSKP